MEDDDLLPLGALVVVYPAVPGDLHEGRCGILGTVLAAAGPGLRLQPWGHDAQLFFPWTGLLRIVICPEEVSPETFVARYTGRRHLEEDRYV